MLKQWLNWQVIQSVIRQAAQWGGGMLATSGVITNEQVPLVVGAALSLGALIWSIAEGRMSKVNKDVTKAVAAAPVTAQTAVIHEAQKNPEINDHPVIDAIKAAINKKNNG